MPADLMSGLCTCNSLHSQNLGHNPISQAEGLGCKNCNNQSGLLKKIINLCFLQASHAINGDFYHALIHSRWVAPIHMACPNTSFFASTICLQLCPTMMLSKGTLNLVARVFPRAPGLCKKLCASQRLQELQCH